MSVKSLTDAAKRWNLGANDVSSWRSRILSSQTTSAPVSHVDEVELHDPASREQFLESLRQRQLAAEARVTQMREAVLSPAEALAEENSSSEEEEEEEENEDSDSEESSEEGQQGTYENELEYYVHELLCIDAITHEPPSGKEEQCPYCAAGKKFESDLACSTCAFVRGVCASCRKVVVLRSLEDPAKGAAVCMALLSDPALMRSTLDLDEQEEADEIEAVREQITFMLDAYFDKNA